MGFDPIQCDSRIVELTECMSDASLHQKGISRDEIVSWLDLGVVRTFSSQTAGTRIKLL